MPFDEVPNSFFQLYTLHCRTGFTYSPFIYFLLPNKTAETYERMFQIVRQKVPIQPSKLILDFEKGAHQAFHQVYPDVPTAGCYFHLKQSVLRKVQEFGLKQRYEQDLDYQILVRSITALAFVPPAQVEELFDEICELFPEDEASDNLLSYFKSTYIQGPVIRRRQRAPSFPVPLWNHYEDALNMAPKTTNCVEGWHNALKAMFLSSHPSVWMFLRGIYKDISIQRLIIIQADTVNSCQPKKKYKQLAERLSNKVSEFNDAVDKMKYIRSVAYMQ